MIDIVYLAHNRLEFTRETLAALKANTEWEHVSRVVIYDDYSTDGTSDFLIDAAFGADRYFGKFGGPVAVMNHYLTHRPAPLWCKLDSDTLVPPGWLTECLRVMDAHPDLDLLGIEAMYPEPVLQATSRTVEEAEYIGGIGFLRTRAFRNLPEPDGRFGFTSWQQHNLQVRKGWLNPPIPVCLMDRLPMEPWVSLSERYVKRGWQRPWAKYDPAQHQALWDWWKPQTSSECSEAR